VRRLAAAFERQAQPPFVTAQCGCGKTSSRKGESKLPHSTELLLQRFLEEAKGKEETARKDSGCRLSIALHPIYVTTVKRSTRWMTVDRP